MKRLTGLLVVLLFGHSILFGQAPPPPPIYKVEILSYNNQIVLADDLNDNGVVVGTIVLSDRLYNPFRWNGQLSQADQFLVVNSLAPTYSFSTINNSGISAGKKSPADASGNKLVLWDGIRIKSYIGVEQFETNVSKKDHQIVSITDGLMAGNVNVFVRSTGSSRIEAPRAFVGFNDNAELLPLYSRKVGMTMVDYPHTEVYRAVVRDNKYYVLGVSRMATNDPFYRENFPTFWIKDKTGGTWQKDNQEWQVKAFGLFDQNTFFTGADRLTNGGDIYACGYASNNSIRQGILYLLNAPWTKREMISLRNNDDVEVLDIRYVTAKSKAFAVGSSGERAVRWMFISETNHTIVDLNDVIERNSANRDLVLKKAMRINNKGQILCRGRLSNMPVSVLLSFR